jgi:hypothetical protein
MMRYRARSICFVKMPFWFKQILGQGLEQREPKKAVLCPQLVMISGMYGHWGKTTVQRPVATV